MSIAHPISGAHKNHMKNHIATRKEFRYQRSLAKHHILLLQFALFLIKLRSLNTFNFESMTQLSSCDRLSSVIDTSIPRLRISHLPEHRARERPVHATSWIRMVMDAACCRAVRWSLELHRVKELLRVAQRLWQPGAQQPTPCMHNLQTLSDSAATSANIKAHTHSIATEQATHPLLCFETVIHLLLSVGWIQKVRDLGGLFGVRMRARIIIASGRRVYDCPLVLLHQAFSCLISEPHRKKEWVEPGERMSELS